MPIIRVEMFKGRSVDQKRALVQELTEAFVNATGGTPESVHVVITDVDKGDWGSGGALCSDKFPD
ncbi:4-oxalocrotonate tautomerase [Roseovarius sp. EL26]|uniref:4-oxalocrotonate tautomerase n=1 Tax=Roseovarius sp. EL26 TaxID=2126672 RepID=UPI000EA08C02|nr:4-oxalocrotonate tautomerase [Roseovarius sp. EL26]